MNENIEIPETQETQDTQELGTQEFLEQLGLPSLDGQVTVEIVVEKSPEEEETASESETSQEEETDSIEDDEESTQEEEETVSEAETSEEEGADATGDEELLEEEDDETSEDEEEETAERSKITVQLNTSAAPVTAANFTDLVEQNFYDALAFHRLVDGFVAQVGDPASRDTDILAELRELGSGQYIEPATGEPRTIPLEIKVKDGEIVYNQIVDEQVELSHEQGVIAMARRNSPLDSASSQFYFTLEDVSNQLDGGYAVFGEVTDGLDNVLGIDEGDRIVLARVVEGNISSRESEIVSDSDLLNDWKNADNRIKVDYVLSMEEEEVDENVDSSGNGTEVSPILEDTLLGSQLDTPLDESPNEDDENIEGEEEGEEEEEGDEIASAIDEEEEEEEEEETTEETEEEDENETLLDIDVADSSFTTELGTEDDDVIDVLEISDAEPDSSFAIMGLAGNDTISGGDGTDILSGNEGDDNVSGRDGSDFIRGGKGEDNLIGGPGDDNIIGDYGKDILTGGADADSFMLRVDTVEGIEEIEQADMITDFSVADSDRIIVIAEFIPSEGLDYELVDGDAVIRLLDSGFILGVVEETSIEDVQNNIIAVNPDDLALTLG
ncbi:peptidylprolyl isomerase [Dapis sp. BLCC M229]|uniref:peptidylprolyl isomerase n=1 Tax=Dapis sp. BLCC M229 TaxID=3400188 RepID=UPI003CEEA7DB